MDSHLSGWNFIPYLFSHKVRLSRLSGGIFLSLWVEILWYRIESLAKSLVLDRTYTGRSLMKTRNRIGFNTILCRTSESTALGSEATPSMTTLWVQSCRNLWIHFRVCHLIPTNSTVSSVVLHGALSRRLY